MFCSRLDHFVKIEPGSKPMFRCCHMISPPKFNSLEEIETSEWLSSVKEKFKNDIWPTECSRCKESEDIGIDSVRLISNKKHKEFFDIDPNYIVVDVVVDTICNAACPICSEDLSSKIAKLKKIKINPFDGSSILQSIPKERIYQIDILGGEPGASRKSKILLEDIQTFQNLKKLHLSTNGSMKIKEIEVLLKKGISIELVISMDGTEKIFEYARFPIKWNVFVETVKYYKNLQRQYPNLSLLIWSSISSLCVADIPNMIKFSQDVEIPLNGSPIHFPKELSISNKNFLTNHALKTLENCDNDFAKKILKLVSVYEESNDKELIKFLKENDSIRKTNYLEIFNYE